MIPCVPTVPINKVYPSAGDLATMSAPKLPPAPGLLSTKNVWPKALESSGAIARAKISVVPAGANGTTMRTCLFGQADCANDKWVAVANAYKKAACAQAASAVRRVRLICIFTCSLDHRTPLGNFSCHEFFMFSTIGALVRHDHST